MTAAELGEGFLHDIPPNDQEDGKYVIGVIPLALQAVSRGLPTLFYNRNAGDRQCRCLTRGRCS